MIITPETIKIQSTVKHKLHNGNPLQNCLYEQGWPRSNFRIIPEMLERRGRLYVNRNDEGILDREEQCIPKVPNELHTYFFMISKINQ